MVVHRCDQLHHLNLHRLLEFNKHTAWLILRSKTSITITLVGHLTTKTFKLCLTPSTRTFHRSYNQDLKSHVPQLSSKPQEVSKIDSKTFLNQVKRIYFQQLRGKKSKMRKPSKNSNKRSLPQRKRFLGPHPKTINGSISLDNKDKVLINNPCRQDPCQMFSNSRTTMVTINNNNNSNSSSHSRGFQTKEVSMESEVVKNQSDNQVWACDHRSRTQMMTLSVMLPILLKGHPKSVITHLLNKIAFLTPNRASKS